MKHFIFLILLNFPFLVTSQVAINFSDNFNLEDSYVYDNWEYSSQSFFVLPLSINDFIPIESYQFNVLYDPQVVQLDHNVIDAINKEDITSSYGVSNAVSGLQGNISAEVFTVSANQTLATISYSHSSPFLEEQFDNGYAVLVYLPFVKVNACSKAPISVSFSDGNIDGQYANPNQINAVIVNQTLTLENGNITTQDAFVNFNILSAEVIQNGSTLESSVNGGAPPYTFEWTDKMDETLSTDSFFSPEQTGDYLFYVYDQNNCNSILFVSYDQTASIEESAKLSIYPIPAKNYIEVSSSNYNYYKLININGLTVDFGNLYQKTLIYRNELPSGIYFLKLSNDSKQSISKVVFH
jgi:hypothetical protein